MSDQSTTGEWHESRRWVYGLGDDHVGNQSIQEGTAISEAIAIKVAIEIVIVYQVCNRDQQEDRDHGGNRDWDRRSGM